MHAHDFDSGLAASPHVSVNREVDSPDPAMLEAASTGRAETLSPGALLNLQRLAGIFAQVGLGISIGAHLEAREDDGKALGGGIMR